LKIYVAGPMTGIPQFNFPAFHRTASALRDLGHEVFNPAEHDESLGLDAEHMTGEEDLSALGFSLREMLHVDTSFICREADAVCLLPGWKNSKGAMAELTLARALGLKAGDLKHFIMGDVPLADYVFKRDIFAC